LKPFKPDKAFKLFNVSAYLVIGVLRVQKPFALSSKALPVFFTRLYKSGYKIAHRRMRVKRKNQQALPFPAKRTGFWLRPKR
jgi:hypothetical protein